MNLKPLNLGLKYREPNSLWLHSNKLCLRVLERPQVQVEPRFRVSGLWGRYQGSTEVVSDCMRLGQDPIFTGTAKTLEAGYLSCRAWCTSWPVGWSPWRTAWRARCTGWSGPSWVWISSQRSDPFVPESDCDRVGVGDVVLLLVLVHVSRRIEGKARTH